MKIIFLKKERNILVKDIKCSTVSRALRVFRDGRDACSGVKRITLLGFNGYIRDNVKTELKRARGLHV